jgi:hypothetical protein
MNMNMKWNEMTWNKMHSCMNEWKNDWMTDLKWMTWNECIGMKDLIWMTWNECIDMNDLKWMNWNERLDMNEWMVEWLNDWMKWKNEMKWNETKWNEMKRNEMKWKWSENEVKWMNWNEGIAMNDLKWMSWNEWIEMSELKSMNWNEWIENGNEGIEMNKFKWMTCQKWSAAVCFFVFYVKSSSRYSLVRLLPTSSAKSSPRPSVFHDLYVKSRSRYSAPFADLIYQKCSEPDSFFSIFMWNRA